MYMCSVPHLCVCVCVCVCVCTLCSQVSDACLSAVQRSVCVCKKRGVGTDGKSRPTTGMSQKHVHQVPSAPASKLTVFFHWHLSYTPGAGQSGLMHTRQGIYPGLVRTPGVDIAGAHSDTHTQISEMLHLRGHSSPGLRSASKLSTNLAVRWNWFWGIDAEASYCFWLLISQEGPRLPSPTPQNTNVDSCFQSKLTEAEGCKS